jgi:hypothetical protein
MEFLANQGAFSKYVKRLIARDMDSVSVPVSKPIQEQVTKQYESPGIVNSFI